MPSSTDPMLPGAPVPNRSRVARALASLRGRFSRDIPDPQTGRSGYSHDLQGRTESDEARVGAALLSVITPLDQLIAGACIELAERRAAIERCDKDLAAVPDADPGSLAAASASRERARLRSEKAGHLRSCAELGAKIGGLASTRRHLIGRARALVDGHRGRYKSLAGAWLGGYGRRRGSPGVIVSAIPAPEYQSRAEWVTNDFPLLLTMVSPAEKQLVHFVLAEFDPPSLSSPPPLRAV